MNLLLLNQYLRPRPLKTRKGSFTEEVKESRKAILEGVFKFSAFEAKNNFDSTDSAVHIEEDQSASPSNKKYQSCRVN